MIMKFVLLVGIEMTGIVYCKIVCLFMATSAGCGVLRWKFHATAELWGMDVLYMKNYSGTLIFLLRC